MIGAECRVVGGDGTLTSEIMNPQIFSGIYQCDENGLLCYNRDNRDDGGCLNYEVRYICQTNSGNTNLGTLPLPSLKNKGGRYFWGFPVVDSVVMFSKSLFTHVQF